MTRRGNSEFVACDAERAVQAPESHCMTAATLSVQLDADTRWLIVVVLPTSAFGLREANLNKAQEVDTQVRTITRTMLDELDRIWTASVSIFAGVVALSVGLALGLGFMMSYPLRQLDSLMRQLGDFKFAQQPTEGGSADTNVMPGLSRRSNIVEVSNLQSTFSRLSQGLEAFARFVPETVVRSIVSGDPRAARLHVSRRNVTIMFSDIRDFTAISESLQECDLLFVLTRYLSVMTRIVEYFDGIVSEVLGDGLLAFWNTPDDVADHPAKACQTALAQQQAMAFLNEEFTKLKLPELSIRIGVHTGSVLSGNLGSEKKMKFGCLGDPINLASRLEGLCKVYGVGIICSGVTRDALPKDYAFFCRRLDLVQVKGKREPTCIYEVMGHDAPAAGRSRTPGKTVNGAGPSARARAFFCKRSSTAALDAIHRSTVSLCRSISSLGDGTEATHSETSEHAWCLPGGVPADFVTSKQRRLAQMYEQTLDAFQGARFLAARDVAKVLLAEFPEDVATRRLLDRVAHHVGPDDSVPNLSDIELAEWTGVSVMTEK